jgi:hypothetical protein
MYRGADDSNLLECADCDVGKFTGEAGQSFCFACDAGLFAAEKKSSSCSECPIGYSQNDKKQDFCGECTIGKYNSETGTTQCVECDAGLFAAETKSSSCIECPIGYSQNDKKHGFCGECMIGTYNTETGTTLCFECDAGRFAAETKSSSCSGCPIGYSQNEKRQDFCAQCKIGKFNSVTGMAQCNLCPPQSTTLENGATSDVSCVCDKDFFARRDQNDDSIVLQCLPCPPNSKTFKSGATNSLQCVCQNGYWKPPSLSVRSECLVCPDFAVCVEGLLPKTKQGYWKIPWRGEILNPAASNTSAQPRLQCLERTACEGAVDITDYNASEQCAQYYESNVPMCAACSRGAYKEAASFKCVGCAKEYSNSVLLMLLVVFGTLGVIIGFTLATVADGGEAAAVDVVILKIAINSGIISAGASAFPLAWPPIVVTMFQMYAVVSASAIGDSLSADCILRESVMKPVQAWGLTMCIIPAMIVLLWTVLFTVLKITTKNEKYLHVYLPVSIIVTATFAHPVVTKSAVKLLACRTVGGKGFLDADFKISCESEEYMTWAGVVAVPLLLLFTFGVPLLYALAMYRHVRRGKLQSQRAVYGFFFSGFREEIWWFELWNTLRKSLFTISAILFAPAGVMMQTWAALVLLMFFLVIFILSQPYKEDYLNHLERSALSINIITLLCGLGLFTNEHAGDDAKSDGLALFLTVVIVIMNILFVMNVHWIFFKHTTYCIKCRKVVDKEDDSDGGQKNRACILNLFQLIDKNSDGKVTKLEMLSAIMRRRAREPELNQAFLDLLHLFPNKAKELLHPRSSKSVLKTINTNNDNIITEKEMLAYLYCTVNTAAVVQQHSATTVVPIHVHPTRLRPPTVAMQKRTSSTMKQQITMKGSMRYNVKVALLMKKATDATQTAELSRETRLQQLKIEQAKSKSRLSDRLQKRSRSSLNRIAGREKDVGVVVAPTVNDLQTGEKAEIFIHHPII